MSYIQRYRYIMVLLPSILFISGCGDGPPDLVFDNPLDSKQDETQSNELPKTIIAKDGAEMVLIPAGEFLSSSNDAWELWDEAPVVQRVYLDAFYMDKYEVTNAQYKKFVQETGHNEPFGDGPNGPNFSPWLDPKFNGENQPVVCVNYGDARAYAEWADKRLPTEAEWEKAARGGLVGKKYVWGDDWPPYNETANLADKTGEETLGQTWGASIEVVGLNGYNDNFVYTAPVGSFPPNNYGLYDMSGNVWEWTAEKVLMGASFWLTPKSSYLVSARFRFDPRIKNNTDGFRCAMDVPK